VCFSIIVKKSKKKKKKVARNKSNPPKSANLFRPNLRRQTAGIYICQNRQKCSQKMSESAGRNSRKKRPLGGSKVPKNGAFFNKKMDFGGENGEK
jgi:ribosomal protein L37AE/L43A